MTVERRFLHDDEAGALKMPHDTLGGDGGHVLGGVMLALAALKPEREGYRVGQVARVGWRELVVGVGLDED